MLARRFPRAIASLPALVAFVREFFLARGLDPDEAFDVDLVVEELFTNMVRHARGGGAEIELGLDREDSVVVVRIRDEGAEPWDPTQAPAPDLERPLERKPGGLGIYLVRRLARDFRYAHENGVTTLTVRLAVGGR
jgi:anti-sigma regulatory factor (Ser/Thr protein kinase)